MSKPFGTPLKIVDPDNEPSEFTDNIFESLNAICESNTSLLPSLVTYPNLRNRTPIQCKVEENFIYGVM
jgi:hypothetical protein